MTDTIAAMIAEVNAAGYFFNNLFQLSDGKWRCNLRSEEMVPSHSEFGTGPDPTTAVAEALTKLQRDKPQRRHGAAELKELDVPDFLIRNRSNEKPAPFTEAESVAFAHTEAAGADDDLIGGSAAQADDLVG